MNTDLQRYGLTLVEGTLQTVCHAIADQLGYDGSGLYEYAKQAHHIEAKRFPGGSGSEDERRILYTLTRVMQPTVALECGVSWGGSSTAILGAMRDADSGSLFSVDNRKYCSDRGHRVGHHIPAYLHPRWSLTIDDAIDYIEAFDRPINFLYEDTDHHYSTTLSIYQAALPKLAPNAVTVSHDAIIYGHRILPALIDAGITPTIYKTDTSACGVAIWQHK